MCNMYCFLMAAGTKQMCTCTCMTTITTDLLYMIIFSERSRRYRECSARLSKLSGRNVGHRCLWTGRCWHGDEEYGRAS